MSNSSDSAAAQAAAVLAAEQDLLKTDFGAIFAGTFIAVLLLGFVLAQLYMYYTRYPKDPIGMKLFVGFILFVDTLSCGILVAWFYIAFINHWGDITVFETGDWLIATDPFFLGFIAMCNHFYFSRRVYLITKNVYLTILICICGLGAGSTGLAVTIIWAKYQFRFQDIILEKAAFTTWMSWSVVGDLLITISITWYLQHRKSGFKKTDTLVDKIIRNTMQNGLLTAATATVDLIMYLAMTQTDYLALSVILPRLHVNSIMSSLNSREPHHVESPSSEASAMFNSRVLRPDHAEVMVHVETHEMAETAKSAPDWEHKTSAV
ncbi:hypothetical protein SCP_1303180 [Sparassis crispa]|uniref:DUF6534 domain-containing protein n=1 Tax=Sparassis crispa TaxID=139825 RepID=A0A401H286_9APHY|nr:hypothetical protein SCP_1303180 [Sparassis crispa]GBE88502.1 hypothetical protein SCP_1303180 [Sparassis crispa]